MTKPAKIETLPARTFCGVEDGVPGLFTGIALVEGNVFQTGAMTFFTFDAQDIVRFGKFIGFRIFIGRLLEPGGMAFQAPRSDRSVKIRLPGITGADRPFIGFGEIRQWQFEQVIMEPVDACLAAFSRSHDNIERPGQLGDAGQIGRLVETIPFSLRGNIDLIVDKKPVGAVKVAF